MPQPEIGQIVLNIFNGTKNGGNDGNRFEFYLTKDAMPSTLHDEREPNEVIVDAFNKVFVHVNESLYYTTISQHDKIEIEKKQSTEYLKLIEIIHNPLRIDVINLGSDIITIKKLFVNGIIDDSYLIDGIVSSNITKNKVVRITPSLAGYITSILTKNYKVFDFE